MKTPLCSLISLGLLGFGNVVFAGSFVPGEILLNNLNGSNLQRYSAAGVLERTYYTGGGIQYVGAALTPDGKLVSSYSQFGSRIEIRNSDGGQISSFAASGSPSDASVFANGTIAFGQQGGYSVTLVSQTGTFLKDVNLYDAVGGAVGGAIGSTVGTDNILYVTGSKTNNLGKISQDGTFLGSIKLGFTAGDLVMSPTDGTLWVSDLLNNVVEHITTDGTVLGNFPTGLTGNFEGIGIAPDGDSLYVTTTSSSVIRHFDLIGNQLGDINIVRPGTPMFLTVVPGAVPEPSTFASLAFGAAALSLRRRPR